MRGGVDAHCHLLPGVDDGAETPEESLAVIHGLRSLGLRGAICTPHIMARFPQNTPVHLRKLFADFSSAVDRKLENSKIQTQDSKFQLHLAAEYMLDETFPRHLESGDLLTIHSAWLTPPQNGELFNCQLRHYVLVELPHYMLPPGWLDMLDSISSVGLIPLLAHPERYLRLLDLRDIRALVDRGVALQGNLGSLSGYYGRGVKVLAQSILDEGLYTTFGTDSHSNFMFERLKLKL